MLKTNPKILNYFYISLPNFFWPIKWYIKKLSLKKCGINFRFGVNSQFNDHRLIEIGNHVFFGQNILINTNVEVTIGDYVMFGPNISIIPGDHNFLTVGKHIKDVRTGGTNQPVLIENDVWIGANTTILKGVTIREGTIVGAGSIVTKDLPPYSVCYGNPCRPRRYRFKKSELATHLNLIKSKYTVKQIYDNKI